jgi:chorismate mutase-like protein
MWDLQELRWAIDTLDREIITMLSRRLEIAKQVALYKKSHGLWALQPDRWQEVLEKVKWIATEHHIDPHFIETMWNMIHDHTLEVEKEIIMEG